jgi:hypothetical protein
MSKKLIAVAAAAALALTGLVAAPANATTAVTTIGTTGTVGKSGADSTTNVIDIDVPADNDVAEAADMVKFTVTSATNKTVSVTATSGVRVVDTATNLAESRNWLATEGKTSLAVSTGNTNTVIFWAYTTSTAAGTVVVNDGVGNTQTFHIKGNFGAPYNIKVAAPTFVGAGQQARILVNVSDVFGNNIAGAANQRLEDVTDVVEHNILATVVGGDAAMVTDDGAFTWDTVRKAFVGKITGRTTDGQVALSIQLLNASAAIVEVDGLGVPADSFFKVFNSGDLSAQLAALQVIVDRKVTKKRYNTLARKWNRAFPSQKVWVKP